MHFIDYLKTNSNSTALLLTIKKNKSDILDI